MKEVIALEKKKINGLKIVSLIVTVLGLGASLASSWVEDKKMEETIAEKVEERVVKALAEHKEESWS